MRLAVCCVAARSTNLRRTSALPLVTGSRRRTASTMWVSVRRGLYHLAPFLLYQLPPKGVGIEPAWGGKKQPFQIGRTQTPQLQNYGVGVEWRRQRLC